MDMVDTVSYYRDFYDGYDDGYVAPYQHYDEELENEYALYHEMEYDDHRSFSEDYDHRSFSEDDGPQDVKPERKPKIKKESKPKIKPEPKEDTKPDVKPNVKGKGKAKAEPASTPRRRASRDVKPEPSSAERKRKAASDLAPRRSRRISGMAPDV
jgi:hypothetical protein